MNEHRIVVRRSYHCIEPGPAQGWVMGWVGQHGPIQNNFVLIFFKHQTRSNWVLMGQSGRELALYVDWINSHPIQYETQPEPGPPISRSLD